MPSFGQTTNFLINCENNPPSLECIIIMSHFVTFCPLFESGQVVLGGKCGAPRGCGLFCEVRAWRSSKSLMNEPRVP